MLAGPDVQGETFENGLLRLVAEGNVPEFHVSLCGPGRKRFFGNRYFRLLFRLHRIGLGRGLQKFIDTLGGHESIFQFRDDAGDLVERFRVLVRVGQKDRQAADRKRRGAGGNDEQRAGHADDGVNDLVDKTGGGIDEGGEEHGLQRMPAEFLVQHIETSRDAPFLRIGLHDLLIFDHFIGVACLRAAGLALR